MAYLNGNEWMGRRDGMALIGRGSCMLWRVPGTVLPPSQDFFRDARAGIQQADQQQKGRSCLRARVKAHCPILARLAPS